jgi:hypothetical protein
LDGREKAFDRRLALEGGLQGIDGRAGRYVTTCMTTHAVGDPVERRGVDRQVLVD